MQSYIIFFFIYIMFKVFVMMLQCGVCCYNFFEDDIIVIGIFCNKLSKGRFSGCEDVEEENFVDLRVLKNIFRIGWELVEEDRVE